MRYHVFHRTNMCDGLLLNVTDVKAEDYQFIVTVVTENIGRLFRIMNGVDGSDEEIVGQGIHRSGLTKLWVRSLSVGDVVIEAGTGTSGQRGYLCRVTGWKSFTTTSEFFKPERLAGARAPVASHRTETDFIDIING